MPDTYYEAGTREGPHSVRKHGNNDPNPHKYPKAFKLYAHQQEMKLYDFGNRKYAKYEDAWNGVPSCNGFRVVPRVIQDAKHNQTINKLKDKLGQAESMFETYYERKKVAPTLLGSLMNALKIVERAKGKALSRSRRDRVDYWSIIPEMWLQWNFGIKPVILELERVLEVMSSDPRPIDVEVKNGYEYDCELEYGDHYMLNSTTMRQKYGCKVYGRNPNSYTAAELGLHRSFSAAWAIVPWGWAVDYFINVHGFLTNFEPQLVGVDVSHEYMTYFERSRGVVSRDKGYYSVKGGRYDGTLLEREPSLDLRERLVPNVLILENLERAVRQASYLSSAIVLTMKGRQK